MADPRGLRDTGVPGLDLTRLEEYLRAQRQAGAPAGPLPTGPLTAELIAGGKSNLTYRVGDGERTVVLRRPPLGHVLATAHDMGREFAVMSALAGSAVPVPRTHLHCADPDVIGAEFYLMDLVPGTPYRTAAELAPLGAERTRALSTAMVETLAALHVVEPAAVGLADFGRPEGFLERQVRRWGRQLDSSRSRDLAGADELRRRLEQQLPGDRHGRPAPQSGIVHGDYRLDNILVDADDRLRAVIDWEMATLGDPLTDVALLLVYGRLADLASGAAVADASTAPGFLTGEEMLEVYATASGRDLSAIGFHLGLAAFKLAVILEGIHYRHLHGQTVGEGFDGVGALVEPLIATGLASTEEH
jgi:aminoglycoside phosphotransferase (APT) family kinase protein